LVTEMSKTKRKQPDWMRDDDRWMRKGAVHNNLASRRKQKQDLLSQALEEFEDGFSHNRRG